MPLGGLSVGLLGRFVLYLDGREIDGLPMKSKALLGYLAAQPGRRTSRERLAEWLWPDREPSASGKNFRNALHRIRKDLGPLRASVRASATELWLVDTLIDAEEFDAAIAASDLPGWRAAAKLWRGPLLDGLAIGSEEFEGWLGVERAKRHAQASELFRRLAEAEARAGEHEASIHAACRLLELDPLSDAGQRTAMRSYALGGRRQSALAQHEAFVKLLRREHGGSPEPETEELARHIACGLPLAMAGMPEDCRRAGTKPDKTRIARQVGTPFAPAPAHWPLLTRKITVGVAPLRNLGGSRIEDGVTEAFTEDLIVDMVRNARGLSCARITAASSDQTAFQLQNSREFDYLVLGSAQPGRPGTIRFTLHIVETSTRAFRWAERYECGMEEVPLLQTRITQRVSSELHFLLIQALSQRAIADIGRELSLAECLSRGAGVLKSGVTPHATADAQLWYLAALARDPRNVDALLGVAVTCQYIVSQPWWSGSAAPETAFAIGQTTADTVIGLQPGHATANSLKGMMYSAAGEVESAARAFHDSIEANSEIPFIHAYAGYNRAFLGRAEGTLTGVEQALRRGGSDRLRSIWYFFAGFSRLLLGADDAMSLLRKSLELNPEYGSAQLFLAAALSMQGRSAEAAQLASEFRGRYPDYRLQTFDQQWLWRSSNPVYRRQIGPVADRVRQQFELHH